MTLSVLMAMVAATLGAENRVAEKLQSPTACPDGQQQHGNGCAAQPRVAVDRGTPAKPANNRARWVTTSDYPAAALQKRAEGTTGIILTVSPEGRVTKCKVYSSSGNSDLDLAACDAASRRAQFEPARDRNGKATVGSYATRIRWQIPSGLPNPIPDAVKIVQSYVIEKDGSVSNCKFERTPKVEDPGTSPCDVMERFEPPTDAEGNPIRKKVAVAVVTRVEDISDKNSTQKVRSDDLSRKLKPRGNVARWITANDYPADALRDKAEGTTRYRLIVSPAGRSRACVIIASSGHSSLDRAACRNAQRRARFDPALDRKGLPIAASWVGSYRWKLP